MESHSRPWKAPANAEVDLMPKEKKNFMKKFLKEIILQVNGVDNKLADLVNITNNFDVWMAEEKDKKLLDVTSRGYLLIEKILNCKTFLNKVNFNLLKQKDLICDEENLNLCRKIVNNLNKDIENLKRENGLFVEKYGRSIYNTERDLDANDLLVLNDLNDKYWSFVLDISINLELMRDLLLEIHSKQMAEKKEARASANQS